MSEASKTLKYYERRRYHYAQVNIEENHYDDGMGQSGERVVVTIIMNKPDELSRSLQEERQK